MHIGRIIRRTGALLVALSFVIGSVGGVAAAPPSLSTTILQSGLSIPWDVGFVPDGRMLVTERAGQLRVYASAAPGAALLRMVPIAAVRAQGESGLMGVAVDIDFAVNRYIYLCASREYSGSGGWVNQVLRYRLEANSTLAAGTVLLSGMQANTTHDGCSLEMDRSARLWIGMGDAANGASAQNRASLNGKILRINRDGSIPSDNPTIGGTRNAVYSMGHRNPQGIAIRPGTNQVYVAEHGPDVNDEINLIVAGGNYGWPCYTGAGVPYQTAGCGPAANYRNPLWASGGSTIATSGAAFASGTQWGDFNGHLFVSTLKESDVRRFSINAAGTALGGPATLFDNAWGRVRGMISGPGGQLYLTTSNGSNDSVIRVRAAAPAVARLAGADRYGTAAAISAATYPGGATRAFVATGENFPDALAGGAAGGYLGAPVLLVTRNGIPQVTRNELARLRPGQIIVLGGTGTVSEAVHTGLVPYSTSGQVARLGGVDRYATAALVSKTWYAPGPPSVFLAVGSGFADALSGAPAAALRSSPLLLVQPNAIPAVTQAELRRLAPQRIFVLGGTGVISAVVAAQLDAYTAGPVTRLAGSDRYATAAAVARAFWTKAAATYVATGVSFADALAGGAAAGRAKVPMLLVTSSGVPLTIGQELLRLQPYRVNVLGGTGVVSSAVASKLGSLIGTP